MNALSIAEKKALELMQKDNFRGISKDNVMQLMSILNKVDPEVAKTLSPSCRKQSGGRSNWKKHTPLLSRKAWSQ